MPSEAALLPGKTANRVYTLGSYRKMTDLQVRAIWVYKASLPAD